MNDATENGPLGRLIYFTAREIGNVAEKLLKPHNLTLEQFQLLRCMSRQEGMNQQRIGALTNKSAANITRILDRLEHKKLVVRRAHPGDRRVSLVFLTARGEGLVRKVFDLLGSFAERLVNGIDPRDQEITRKTLEKITANVRKMEEK